MRCASLRFRSCLIIRFFSWFYFLSFLTLVIFRRAVFGCRTGCIPAIKIYHILYMNAIHKTHILYKIINIFSVVHSFCFLNSLRTYKSRAPWIMRRAWLCLFVRFSCVVRLFWRFFPAVARFSPRLGWKCPAACDQIPRGDTAGMNGQGVNPKISAKKEKTYCVINNICYNIYEVKYYERKRDCKSVHERA